MRQSQARFHVFAYTHAGLIARHYRVNHWPSVQERLSWMKENLPHLTTRVKDINLQPLGKHQRV